MERRPKIDLAGGGRTDGRSPGTSKRRSDEVRCDCGSLLARWTPQGVELKCRRCKRCIIIPVEGQPPGGPAGD